MSALRPVTTNSLTWERYHWHSKRHAFFVPLSHVGPTQCKIDYNGLRRAMLGMVISIRVWAC